MSYPGSTPTLPSASLGFTDTALAAFKPIPFDGVSAPGSYNDIGSDALGVITFNRPGVYQVLVSLGGINTSASTTSLSQRCRVQLVDSGDALTEVALKSIPMQKSTTGGATLVFGLSANIFVPAGYRMQVTVENNSAAGNFITLDGTKTNLTINLINDTSSDPSSNPII